MVLLILFGEQWIELAVTLQSDSIVPLPVPDVQIDYLTGLFWAIVTFAVVAIWGSFARIQRALTIAWLAKVMVALGPMLLFDYVYGVDPDGYFHNASTPGFEWQGLHLGLGTQNTQMLAWLHYRGISTSFNASRLSFAFVGLIGVFLSYRAVANWTGRQDVRLFYAFALTPSILFWSSTLSKDSITFAGIAAYFYGVVGWYSLGKSRYLVWVVMGVTVAAYIRFWFGPILLIPLAGLGWARSQGIARRGAFIGLGLLGILASPVVMQETLGIDLTSQDEVLDSTNSLSRVFMQGGSTLEVPELATFGQLAGFAPLGIFTTLFRPFPGEVPNLFGTLAGFENVFLLTLAARAIWRTKLRELREPLVIWVITAVLIWASVYSIASFQNLGTLSRYRLQIMPLFYGGLLYLGRSRRRQQEDPQSSVTVRAVPMRPGI